jgi:hypothetical protein
VRFTGGSRLRRAGCTRDARATDELAAQNSITAPAVRLDDEVVISFNRERLEALLADEAR